MYNLFFLSVSILIRRKKYSNEIHVQNATIEKKIKEKKEE